MATKDVSLAGKHSIARGSWIRTNVNILCQFGRPVLLLRL